MYLTFLCIKLPLLILQKKKIYYSTTFNHLKNYNIYVEDEN